MEKTAIDVILALAFLNFVEFLIFCLFIYQFIWIFKKFDMQINSVWDLMGYTIFVYILYRMAIDPFVDWGYTLTNILHLVVNKAILHFWGLR